MSATLLPRVNLSPVHAPAAAIAVGPYIVGADGTERAAGALRAAKLLTTRFGTRAEVVSVIEPIPIASPEVQLPVTPELEATRRADRIRNVREQIESLTGDRRTWPVELRTGSPAQQIIEKGQEAGANLVIVGLGRHGVVDRIFGDETALHLLRMSSIPVLAVPHDMERLPTRALVAMDFSASAICAARLAAELLVDGGTLSIVHVIPRGLESSVREMQSDFDATIQTSFDQVVQLLSAPRSVSVQTVILHGDPAHEILEFAERTKAGLIAAGSHGHGFFSRLLLGSVTTKLLRGTTSAFLMAPLMFATPADG